MSKLFSFLLIPVAFVILALFFLMIASEAGAKRLNHEAYYQEIICTMLKGEAEVTMVDNTRCDCLTDTHAIEVDFGDKWPEGIGQALHYSRLTGKQAGVVLIIESDDDMRYWDRLNAVIDHFDLPIRTWIVLDPPIRARTTKP